MFKLLTTVYTMLAALSVTAGASAAAPEQETFTFPYAYVATDCGFPVAVEGVFTNRIVDHAAQTGTGTLQLHQSDVATATANGVTLRVNSHYTIMVVLMDDVPVTAKHVGLLDSIMGPNGEHIFFRTGQAGYEVVFDPVSGFYVDGPLITRHGIRDDFDHEALCAAFG
jgi:hypothetical protein